MTAMARLVLLYFLLWVGVTVSTVVDLQKRIVDGQPCDKADRLYHVRLRATDGTRTSLCGGSLIADQWVLTAAHCWKPGRTMYADVNFHPGDKLETMEITEPKKIYEEKHDIMLLKLPRKPKSINTVSLPADCTTDLKEKDQFQVAGYVHGADETGLKKLQSKDALHCAKMTVADSSRIKAVVDKCYENKPLGHWFCAEGDKVDTASGDSGSGAVVDNKIYGVYKGSNEYKCVMPVLLLRVCAYIDWINDTIKK